MPGSQADTPRRDAMSNSDFHAEKLLEADELVTEVTLESIPTPVLTSIVLLLDDPKDLVRLSLCSRYFKTVVLHAPVCLNLRPHGLSARNFDAAASIALTRMQLRSIDELMPCVSSIDLANSLVTDGDVLNIVQHRRLHVLRLDGCQKLTSDVALILASAAAAGHGPTHLSLQRCLRMTPAAACRIISGPIPAPAPPASIEKGSFTHPTPSTEMDLSLTHAPRRPLGLQSLLLSHLDGPGLEDLCPPPPHERHGSNNEAHFTREAGMGEAGVMGVGHLIPGLLQPTPAVSVSSASTGANTHAATSDASAGLYQEEPIFLPGAEQERTVATTQEGHTSGGSPVGQSTSTSSAPQDARGPLLPGVAAEPWAPGAHVVAAEPAGALAERIRGAAAETIGGISMVAEEHADAETSMNGTTGIRGTNAGMDGGSGRQGAPGSAEAVAEAPLSTFPLARGGGSCLPATVTQPLGKASPQGWGLRSLALHNCGLVNAASLRIMATACPNLEALLLGGSGLGLGITGHHRNDPTRLYSSSHRNNANNNPSNAFSASISSNPASGAVLNAAFSAASTAASSATSTDAALNAAFPPSGISSVAAPTASSTATTAPLLPGAPAVRWRRATSIAVTDGAPLAGAGGRGADALLASARDALLDVTARLPRLRLLELTFFGQELTRLVREGCAAARDPALGSNYRSLGDRVISGSSTCSTQGEHAMASGSNYRTFSCDPSAPRVRVWDMADLAGSGVLSDVTPWDLREAGGWGSLGGPGAGLVDAVRGELAARLTELLILDGGGGGGSWYKGSGIGSWDGGCPGYDGPRGDVLKGDVCGGSLGGYGVSGEGSVSGGSEGRVPDRGAGGSSVVVDRGLVEPSRPNSCGGDSPWMEGESCGMGPCRLACSSQSVGSSHLALGSSHHALGSSHASWSHSRSLDSGSLAADAIGRLPREAPLRANSGLSEQLPSLVRAAATCSDRVRRTPLHWAAADGDLLAVAALLLAVGPTACNPKDVRGATPLFLAAETGHTNTVRLLLSAGADPLTCNSAGECPLYIASLKGHVGCVRSMLAHCAAVGQDWCQPSLYGDEWTPLHASVLADRRDVLEALLLAAAATTTTTTETEGGRTSVVVPAVTETSVVPSGTQNMPGMMAHGAQTSVAHSSGSKNVPSMKSASDGAVSSGVDPQGWAPRGGSPAVASGVEVSLPTLAKGGAGGKGGRAGEGRRAGEGGRACEGGRAGEVGRAGEGGRAGDGQVLSVFAVSCPTGTEEGTGGLGERAEEGWACRSVADDSSRACGCQRVLGGRRTEEDDGRLEDTGHSCRQRCTCGENVKDIYSGTRDMGSDSDKNIASCGEGSGHGAAPAPAFRSNDPGALHGFGGEGLAGVTRGGEHVGLVGVTAPAGQHEASGMPANMPPAGTSYSIPAAETHPGPLPAMPPQTSMPPGSGLHAAPLPAAPHPQAPGLPELQLGSGELVAASGCSLAGERLAALVNARNRYGQSALHLAARRGSPYFLTTLLKAGACAQMKDSYGRLPLDEAKAYGQTEVSAPHDGTARWRDSCTTICFAC
eukprot:jgi/Mesvir1/2560/Mv01998-RA.3